MRDVSYLQEALSRRQLWRLRDAAEKPPGVIGWWPAHAVTFLDNHDTGSTQQHWPFPLEHLHEVGRAPPVTGCKLLGQSTLLST